MVGRFSARAGLLVENFNVSRLIAYQVHRMLDCMKCRKEFYELQVL